MQTLRPQSMLLYSNCFGIPKRLWRPLVCIYLFISPVSKGSFRFVLFGKNICDNSETETVGKILKKIWKI